MTSSTLRSGHAHIPGAIPFWRHWPGSSRVGLSSFTVTLGRRMRNNISDPRWLTRTLSLCGFGCNAECIILPHCWGRNVPLNLLHKPLCSNLAQWITAKFHELHRQALNPPLCSWSATVIQADAIKNCLFMRLLTSKTFLQTSCASSDEVTSLPFPSPCLHNPLPCPKLFST